jgi:hypothetical protein
MVQPQQAEETLGFFVAENRLRFLLRGFSLYEAGIIQQVLS